MTGAQPFVPQAKIDTAVTTLRGELARADSKASLLLALTGAALFGAVSAASNAHLPAAAEIVGMLGLAAVLAATVLLLLAVLPNLGGPGWPRWPEMPPEQLHEALAAGARPEGAQTLAALARRKMRLIRHAVQCILAGVGLLALADLLAVLI
ncbi:MAG: DUF5706 domain-containing protein [Streptomyces sp.]|jgi:hypothetical protein|nr:DUF5706 domain-containing protein [Streptomyces sp.]